MSKWGWYVLGGIVIVSIFQLFLRYTYVPQGYRTLRIDRVSGSSCFMPCTSEPPSTPKPLPTFEDVASGNNRAIQIAQGTSDATTLMAYNHEPTYQWKVEHEYSSSYGVEFSDVQLEYGTELNMNRPKGMPYVPFPEMPAGVTQFAPPNPSWTDPQPTPYPLHYPIREVCYCDSKGTGWRWEVRLDTGEVYRVDGNEELEKRYDITPTTPTP